ncbi:hypothetical protein BHM03_00061857 [Ensete ventricosum]|nr:hypothetical protein BHM03_00061857 [Ensete ventricosum]
MLSYDSEKREGVCHEPEPLLVLMGQATTAIGKGVVRQGSTGEVEEEDGDGSDSDVSKAFTVTLLKQDGRGEEEGDMVDNVEKAAVGNGAGCGIGSDPFAATHATAKLTMGAASDEEKGSGHLCQREVIGRSRQEERRGLPRTRTPTGANGVGDCYDREGSGAVGQCWVVEEEDGDGSDNDVSKAFTVMLLRQDGRGEEEGDVVDNIEKAAGICCVSSRKGCSIFVERTEVDRLHQVLGSPTPDAVRGREQRPEPSQHPDCYRVC